MEAAALVRAIDGPKIVVPTVLCGELGIEAAAFLSQAAFLSACSDAHGWFFLKARGEARADADSLFLRLGSWEACLGIGPKVQRRVRRRLVASGLLSEDRRGVPAKIFYRVDLDAYVLFLAQIGSKPARLSDVPEGHILERPEGTSWSARRAHLEAPGGHILKRPEGTSIYKEDKQDEKHTHLTHEVCKIFHAAVSTGKILDKNAYLKSLIPGYKGLVTDAQAQAALARGEALAGQGLERKKIQDELKRQEIFLKQGDREAASKIQFLRERLGGLAAQSA